MRAFRLKVELLLIVCSVLIVFTEGQAVRRSSFGEYCNDTIKCDKKAWLKCQSSSCACLMEEMVHDPTKGMCVSKPGERCKFQISENLGVVLFENTECVANAHCDNGFTCSCDPGYFESVDGNCEEQKDVNASCSSSVECKESKFLFCLQGQCLCSEGHAHLYATPHNNNSTSMCVTKAGKTISGGTPCIEGTTPLYDVCVCNEAEYHYGGDDGRCHKKRDFGESCAADEECQFTGKYFTCIGGKCGCDEQKFVFYNHERTRIVDSYQLTVVWGRNHRSPFGYELPERRYEKGTDRVVEGLWLKSVPGTNDKFGYVNESIQILETDKPQCIGLARQPCNPESRCVSNAQCVNDVCTCAENYSPTSIGICGIGFGHFCSNQTSCSDSFQCTNDVCNCPQANHHLYDEDLKKCVGRVSSYCSDDSDCSSNSVCRTVVETGQKQCICATGFVENRSGVCDKAWNSTCVSRDSTPCDTVAQLECRNGFCACADTLTSYDPTQRRCFGIVGARCYSDPAMSPFQKNVTECSAGAHCVKMTSHPWIAGRCLCQKDFEVTSDKLCHKMATDEEENVIEESGREIITLKMDDLVLLPLEIGDTENPLLE